MLRNFNNQSLSVLIEYDFIRVLRGLLESSTGKIRYSIMNYLF